MKKFMDYQPDQMMLMPTVLTDWLPKDHEIFLFRDLIGQLDLSAIEEAYKGGGHPAYAPVMMVQVLCYAYVRGVRSSRKIERMLYEDIAMRVLSGNQQPDHWTIAHFRRRHREALSGLLEQSVRLAMTAGLVKMEHVAIDGTKLRANASKHAAMSYDRMGEEEKRLKEEIEAYLKGAEEDDAREDEAFGDLRDGQLPEELSTPEKRLKAIQKAKAQLEAEARAEEEKRREEAEKMGKKPRATKRKGLPRKKAQRNFTDPDSRIMRSQGTYVQGYNAQLAVDAKTQIIVAADLTNQASDTPHLLAMVDEVVANTGRRPKEVSADAGYYSQANVDGLKEHGIEAFIPPERISHMHWRTAKSPRGRIPKYLDDRGRMMRKLHTKRGKERYKLRQTTVEPVIGQIKWNRQLHQLLQRGLDNAKAAWSFDCAVHNLIKIMRAQAALA